MVMHGLSNYNHAATHTEISIRHFFQRLYMENEATDRFIYKKKMPTARCHPCNLRSGVYRSGIYTTVNAKLIELTFVQRQGKCQENEEVNTKHKFEERGHVMHIIL